MAHHQTEVGGTPTREGLRPTGFLAGSTAKVILPLLIYKAIVLGSVWLIAHGWPGSFSLGSYQANFHWPTEKSPGPAERFTTWDGEHYLYLSRNGYQSGSPSAAFYPLWPALIRLTATLTSGDSLMAALLLANLLSLAGWLLFHRLVAIQHGDEWANYALALLVIFPGSIFFQFPYSESLFLLLILLFFTGLFRQKYWLVAVTGFLLPLSRAIGIFCLLPLAWHLWERARKENRGFPFIDRVSLVCLTPLLGYAAYFGIIYAFTGNALEGLAAQKNYVNQPSLLNLVDVPGFIRAFFNVTFQHGMIDSPIDRGLFVLFLALLPSIWRMDKTCFFYAVACGLVPALSNWFFSYNRFLSLCFPLFIVLAGKLKGRENRLKFFYVAALMAALQICFILRHINFRWAG